LRQRFEKNHGTLQPPCTLKYVTKISKKYRRGGIYAQEICVEAKRENVRKSLRKSYFALWPIFTVFLILFHVSTFHPFDFLLLILFIIIYFRVYGTLSMILWWIPIAIFFSEICLCILFLILMGNKRWCVEKFERNYANNYFEG